MKHPERETQYRQFFPCINKTEFSPLLRSSQVKRFEEANLKIALNVFAIDDTSKNGQKIVYPWRISPRRGEGIKVINLLILPKQNDLEQSNHVVLITDLGRLLRRQATGFKARHWACPFCLTLIHMGSKHNSQTDGPNDYSQKIALHEKLCSQIDAQVVTYPPANSKLAFTRIDASVSLMHFIIFDCETREVKREGPNQPPEVALPPGAPRIHPWVKWESENQHLRGDPRSKIKRQQRPCSSCTSSKPCQYVRDSKAIQARLELFSLGYQVVTTNPGEPKFAYREYFGEEEIQSKLLCDLKNDLIEIKSRQRTNVPLRMSSQDYKKHIQVKNCQLCNVE